MTKRLAMLGALMAVLIITWLLVDDTTATPVAVQPVFAPAPSERVESVRSGALERAAAPPEVPAVSPAPEPVKTAVGERAPDPRQLAVALTQQQQAWLPPAPTDLVFDLDGDHRVEPDEQARAAELLERAHQFAGNRSADGTYPILKPDFRGSGRLFRAMDTDADGALTEREFLAFEADSIRELRRCDQNADGALSKAEFGHLDSRFDYLDEDHDGALYAWEITLMRGRGKW
ncbi:MAG: hypothetical protein GQE15_32645 [Archangiaceae bacterium]|nr:hypothetical protein [Archangiaceae bacterium]